MIEYFFGSIIACAIGIIAAIIGMGGGFLYVPTLTLVFDLDQRMAVGTSLAVMIFASLSASVCYQKQGKLLYRAAFLLIVPSILGSVLGSFCTTLIEPKILVGAFSIVLILISVEMLFPAFRFVRVPNMGPVCTVSVGTKEHIVEKIRIPCLHLIIWGTIGGFMSGITGISGGVFLFLHS